MDFVNLDDILEIWGTPGVPFVAWGYPVAQKSKIDLESNFGSFQSHFGQGHADQTRRHQ